MGKQNYCTVRTWFNRSSSSSLRVVRQRLVEWRARCSHGYGTLWVVIKVTCVVVAHVAFFSSHAQGLDRVIEENEGWQGFHVK